MRSTVLALLLFLATSANVSVLADDGHDEHYEWAGIFDVTSAGDTLQWVAQKVDGAYADAAMKFVVMGVASDSEEDLESAEADADTLLESGSCTEVDVGDAAIVPSTTACYELHFDASLDTSTYDLDVTGVDHIAIFTEHFPTEFEADTHYLQSAAGEDVEPAHTLPEDGDHSGHDHGGGGDDEHAGHDHGGGEAYEWAGIFDVSDSAPTNIVQWVAQKVDGAYADPAMKFVVISTASDSEEALEGAEAYADTLLDMGSCTEVDVGDAAIVPSTSVCYELHFDIFSHESTYDIDVMGVDHIAIFAEHFPTEFERSTHYLLTTDGEDIEPVHELPEEHDDDEELPKAWGIVFLSCLLVNLVTFSGVALVGTGVLAPGKNVSDRFQAILMSFASGALISCAVFLILIESSHYVASEWNEAEVDATWRWGCAVIGGFLAPLVVFILEPRKFGCSGANFPPAQATTVQVQPANSEKEGVEGGGGAPVVATESFENRSGATILAVCGGDFAHNITDGFAIGVAFKLCDQSMGWGIFAATVYHEIAQEIADFVILTSPECGLSVMQALIFNFVAGTSVIIGGLITTAIDVDNGTLGLMLAFGGGTYLFLGCVETLPRALEKAPMDDPDKTKEHYRVVLYAWIVGCVLVGLILINHEHCMPGGDDDGDDDEAVGDDAHAGHNHF